MGKLFRARSLNGRELELGEAVDVWKINLDHCHGDSAHLFNLLDENEKSKALSNRFEINCCRFVACRAVLKILLGCYLSIKPSGLEFEYNDYGKPKLADRINLKNIKFNVSHSKNIAVIGIAKNNEIGIDIEEIDENIPYMELSDFCFSVHEQNSLRELQIEDRAQGFFNCWTRKEAFIKAIGMGLSFPLKEFNVTLDPGEAAEIIDVNHELYRDLQWTVDEFSVSTSFAGALVIQGVKEKIRYWEWNQPEGGLAISML